ncbi:MAG TPA: hypothetical protein VLJ10_03265 [Candidatus Bathyarchaeia archaeon]|nr:hypothetical protein [Candidatus Bathyarchaeia archaeon]
MEKLFFTVDDIQKARGLDRASARVYCARKAACGDFIRLKKDFYVRKAEFSRYSLKQLFVIANFLQVPSYISLTTALQYYGLTTQVQQDFIESVSLKRTIQYEEGGVVFYFKKIAAGLYSGFRREGNFFIATPEKALLDSIYLSGMGRYALDETALELSKFDLKKVKAASKAYPGPVGRKVKSLWKI